MNNSGHDEPGKDVETHELPFYVRFIATGFFTGYSPWASGTVGSLVGALFFFIPGFSNPYILFPVIIAGIAAGIYTSARVAETEGHRLTRSAAKAKERFQPGAVETPDPSIVVIDEIVGMWIAMAAISPSLVSLITGFVAFRVFDIVKPYPARQVERYGSGVGIMLDDVVAGIYANIVTRVLTAILMTYSPHLF